MVAQSIERIVRERAKDRCEYCRLPQAFSTRHFQIDHVHARQHLSDDFLDNLALSCDRCNGNKGPNVAGIDLASREVVPLFNPRTQVWNEHFVWVGPLLLGLTRVGIVTIHVLKVNHASAVALRAAIMRLGRF